MGVRLGARAPAGRRLWGSALAYRTLRYGPQGYRSGVRIGEEKAGDDSFRSQMGQLLAARAAARRLLSATLPCPW